MNFDNVPANAAASAVFIESRAKKIGYGGLLIPMRIVLIGQYNLGKTPTVNVPVNLTDADTAAALYGFGSELHLMAKAAFKMAGIVPIDAIPVSPGTTAATGTFTVTGPATSAGTIALYVGGQRISVAVASGDSANTIAAAINSAINAATALPATGGVATNVVTVTSRYKGVVANGISLGQDLSSGDAAGEPLGVTIAIGAMAGGATNPDPTAALAALGNTFYTHIGCGYTDATSLAAYKAAGDARFLPGVKKPIEVYVPSASDYSTFNGVVAALNTQWITFLNVEGLYSSFPELVGTAVGAFAAAGQSTPERPLKNIPLSGIRGNPAKSWTYAQADATVKAGGSVFRTSADGSVTFSDVVTTYKTTVLGAADDTWRQTQSVHLDQAKTYFLDNLFSGSAFSRATVIDDLTVTDADYAISPRRLKQFLVGAIDAWVKSGWTKNRDQVVASIVTEIDTNNAARLNTSFQDSSVSGLSIIAVQHNWAF